MTDQLPAASKSWSRWFVELLFGFLIFIAVGKFFEILGSRESINYAHQLQMKWIKTVEELSPGRLAQTFFEESLASPRLRCLRSCPQVRDCSYLQGEADKKCQSDWRRYEICSADCRARYADRNSGVSGSGALGLFFMGFVMTAGTLWAVGEYFLLLQLGIATLAIIALRRVRKRLFIFEGPIGFVFVPLAIVGAGTAIAFIFKLAMLAALHALGWLTGLAALAAGATGVLGACWFCAVKIGEKSTEHILTHKIKF